ncbi:MAG: hypothetical protein JST19_16225 [Bacteroidetes bacterium]|nr:hypothetical protein [Bacteroidota bacterium]
MEVHHHPEVEKKGFKEYLLEGLMIFLAVMMGFIAENIRESITEHSRAKEYAETMVADLSSDTVFMRDYRTYYAVSSKHVDTLMQLLTAGDVKSIPSGKLYWYGLFGGAFAYFAPNDATFQQMKSSGTIRYFNKSIAREVARYDQLCRQMQTMEENDRVLYSEVRMLRAKIFEFQYNSQANDLSHAHDPQNRDWKKINAFLTSNPPLLTYDKSIFNQYVELARSRFMERKVSATDTLLKRNKALIADLKKAYHIDD